MKIVEVGDVAGFVNARGGRLWVWLDPHGGMGGPAVIYLLTATERPGTSKATRKLRSARRAHRFRNVPHGAFEIALDPGTFDPPEELHLVVKRFPKPRVDAFWNGAIFVDDEMPPT